MRLRCDLSHHAAAPDRARENHRVSQKGFAQKPETRNQKPETRNQALCFHAREKWGTSTFSFKANAKRRIPSVSTFQRHIAPNCRLGASGSCKTWQGGAAYRSKYGRHSSGAGTVILAGPSCTLPFASRHLPGGSVTSREVAPFSITGATRRSSPIMNSSITEA